MNLLSRRLLPTRIAAQLAVVVVISVALIHLVVAGIFYFLSDRGERRDGFAHLGTLVQLVAGASPGAARADLVAEIARTFPQVAPTLADRPPENLSNRFDGGPIGPFFDDLR